MCRCVTVLLRLFASPFGPLRSEMSGISGLLTSKELCRLSTGVSAPVPHGVDGSSLSVA